MQVLERGQERFNVYCTPCHSRVGNGAGMIVQRGYAPAGNFHTARLQAAPLGHFFNVMTNGYGAMPDYSAQLTPADRWAIVAYIRALQLSQNATQADVAPGSHVEPLDSIAEKEGLPASFAERVDPACHGGPRHAHRRHVCIAAKLDQFEPWPGSDCRLSAENSKFAGRRCASRTNRTEAVTSEASERRLETHVIWTRT